MISFADKKFVRTLKKKKKANVAKIKFESLNKKKTTIKGKCAFPTVCLLLCEMRFLFDQSKW